jgi:hypothetical protein
MFFIGSVRCRMIEMAPGVERQPLKKLEPDEVQLLKLMKMASRGSSDQACDRKPAHHQYDRTGDEITLDEVEATFLQYSNQQSPST